MQLKFKLLAIGILILVLTIALMMINGLVSERQSLQHEVQQEIARSSSGPQQIIGPFLVAKFKREVLETTADGKAQRLVTRYSYKNLLPKKYNFNGNLDTQYRALGIYKALLYQASNDIQGEFIVPPNWAEKEDATLMNIVMVTAISDVRGIQNGLALTLNDKAFELLPSTGNKRFKNGVHSAIDPQWLTQQHKLKFKLTLNLLGMESLDIAPIGQETTVNLAASWPHPSFIGNYLPIESTIDENSFTAHWQTTFFATNMAKKMNSCITSAVCDDIYHSVLGVSLVDPVNQYLKTDRAIKYAELFILLILFGFMAFEIFKGYSVHPVQYTLVGVAMALFYLLLLSLSEHIDFNTAYIIASVSCAAVLGIYISGVLGEIKHGLLFSAGVLVLYAILFGLLAAEDFALLMGSIFVFALVGTVMIVTRHVDWYQLGKSKASDESTEIAQCD
ncbi:cell envelope integrity protein CreD [Psychrobium sp. MM17-31]|uniref:cell envelope integrity protein CreD n=1 Tax=Psychrobium sp. MM17-31 TaxID=2917758 RepID=UPI001EF5E34D|nr:cell envelope integrity protein CreD [Psychrobium sp. MM17-31]MCG7533038.1 cell envelope integrity protein CreD [Psychrobium sp. MM17-31]